MEERYLVIDNDQQYYVVLKCNRLQLDMYNSQGKSLCLNEEGILDLFKISDWLIEHCINHTVIFNSNINKTVRLLIQRDLDIILPKAINEGLLIPNEEIENLLLMSIEKRSEKFWIT